MSVSPKVLALIGEALAELQLTELVEGADMGVYSLLTSQHPTAPSKGVPKGYILEDQYVTGKAGQWDIVCIESGPKLSGPGTLQYPGVVPGVRVGILLSTNELAYSLMELVIDGGGTVNWTTWKLAAGTPATIPGPYGDLNAVRQYEADSTHKSFFNAYMQKLYMEDRALNALTTKYTINFVQASSGAVNTQLVSIPLTNSAVYRIEAFIVFYSAAATNGIRIGAALTGDNSFATAYLDIEVPLLNTAAATGLKRTIVPGTVEVEVVGTTAGGAGSAFRHVVKITGIVDMAIGKQSGNFTTNLVLRFGSEVSGTAITVEFGGVYVSRMPLDEWETGTLN